MSHVLSFTYASGGESWGKKIALWGIPDVWVRFLLAIIGLCLAFAAALFSTVSRDAGSVWGTVVLASLALLLAAGVGLATVPYLARRVAVSRVRNAFDYDVTRAGIVYFLAVMIIGIAALNTGNNLLYIVLAAMLAAILVSGIVSALALSGLELEVQLPEYVFAGEEERGRIVLRNPRRFLPSFSVSVISRLKQKEAKRWQWVPSTFGFPTGRPPEQQWVRIADWKLKRTEPATHTRPILESPAYFPYVSARGSQALAPTFCFSRRGLFQQGALGLSTRFPFAFLKKTRIIPSENEIVVFPRLLPIDALGPILARMEGEAVALLRGHGVELHSIRDGIPEDSFRHVDWKATAKSGTLKVREFTREDERRLRIVFDNPRRKVLDDREYEAMVETAAALTWHLSHADVRLSFAATGLEEGATFLTFMRYLATVEPQNKDAATESASLLSKLNESKEFSIILTTEPPDLIPAHLSASSHVIFPAEFLN